MVVGWAMAATEDEQWLKLALRMAVVSRHPPAGLLHHSDRGSEFTSGRYQASPSTLGIEVSIGGQSRTGDCYDNAVMESFFATLTKECTDRVRFQTRKRLVPPFLSTWSAFITRSVTFDVTVCQSGCF